MAGEDRDEQKDTQTDQHGSRTTQADMDTLHSVRALFEGDSSTSRHRDCWLAPKDTAWWKVQLLPSAMESSDSRVPPKKLGLERM